MKSSGINESRGDRADDRHGTYRTFMITSVRSSY